MFNVCRTSVAHLNRVPVEYFTQRMVFREFFIQYLEKFTPDVCRYVSAIWGVVPDDSSRTVSSLLVGLVCNRRLVPQLIVVSTIIYTLLVWGCSFFKRFFV